MQILNPFEEIAERLSRIEHCLLDLKQGSFVMPPQSSREKLNIQQLSEYTGIPVNTLYGMSSRGELPCSKVGKRLLFDRKKIDQLLEEKRKKTAAEIRAEAEEFLSLQK